MELLGLIALIISTAVIFYRQGKKDGKKESDINLTFKNDNGDYTVVVKASEEVSKQIAKVLDDMGIKEE